MKNILLINSPFEFPDKEIHITEPLGLEYLASTLYNNNYNVFIYDSSIVIPKKIKDNLYSFELNEKEIINFIKIKDIDCIGISCHYSFSANSMYKLIEKIKNIYPFLPIVVGGLYISVFEEKALKECDYIDFGLIGESENTFLELLNNIERQYYIEDIDGLIYRYNDKIVKNKKCNYIKNLDEISFPGRYLLDIKPYMLGSTNKKLYGLGYKPSLSILTSRSCPNNCSFCNMKLVHGNKWRSRSVNNVIEEIEIIINKYKAEHLFIMDDNFTFNINRSKEICEQIIRKNLKIKWNTPNGISIKNVDLKLVKLMKKSGCASVSIAIESGSEYIRNVIMNKKIYNSDIVRVINYFKKVNIPVIGYIIVGMLGETEKMYKESYDFIKKLNLTSVVVSYATPFPKTKFNEDLINLKILDKNFSLELDDLNTPIFETDYFTKEDVIKRKQEIKNLFPGLGILSKLVK